MIKSWHGDFFSSPKHPTGSGAQPASYSMGISSSSPLAKQLGSETEHSSHIMPMLRISVAIPSLPHTPACRT